MSGQRTEYAIAVIDPKSGRRVGFPSFDPGVDDVFHDKGAALAAAVGPNEVVLARTVTEWQEVQ